MANKCLCKRWVAFWRGMRSGGWGRERAEREREAQRPRVREREREKRGCSIVTNTPSILITPPYNNISRSLKRCFPLYKKCLPLVENWLPQLLNYNYSLKNSHKVIFVTKYSLAVTYFYWELLKNLQIWQGNWELSACTLKSSAHATRGFWWI